MVKKRRRPKSKTPGIAHKIVQQLRKFQTRNVVDLAQFRHAKEVVLAQRSEAMEGLEDLHPLHAAYSYVMETASSMASLLVGLPELSKLGERIEAAEEAYMPSGPPMSPITKSYFANWTLFDLTVGLQNDSLGSCVAAVSRAVGSHPSYVEFLEQLCRTRPGLYTCEGQVGEAFALEELVTGRRHATLVPSGYDARRGDLLLLRLLPAFGRDFPLALAVTTPYLIVSPGRSDWEAYFERTLRGLGHDPAQAYEALMKRGAAPHGPRYWTEYIFEAYANHRTEVVLLEGLPDVAEGRPHSRVSAAARERPERAEEPQIRHRPAAPRKQKSVARKPSATIAKTLPVAELERLPKLSATLLEFGRPVLDEFPPGATVEDLGRAMKIVEMAWNFPLLQQHRGAEFTRDLTALLERQMAQMPPEAEIVIRQLLHDRAVRHAHDPRLAEVSVRDHGGGDIRVHANSRLLDGPPPGWTPPPELG